jgi:hypothetical protein
MTTAVKLLKPLINQSFYTITIFIISWFPDFYINHSNRLTTKCQELNEEEYLVTSQDYSFLLVQIRCIGWTIIMDLSVFCMFLRSISTEWGNFFFERFLMWFSIKVHFSFIMWRNTKIQSEGEGDYLVYELSDHFSILILLTNIRSMDYI